MNLLKIFTLAVLSSCAVMAQDKVIFQDPFRSMPDGPIPAEKWAVRGDAARTFSIQDGALVLKMEPSLRRGDSVSFPIPLCVRGQLDYEAWVSGCSSQYGAGLTVVSYGITSFFHAGCRDWRSYFPAPEADRPREYWDEAPGHEYLTAITPGKWMHCRIIFDRMKDTVEFYLDDMENPVSLKHRIAVWGADEFLGGKITIANMGQAASYYETRIRNIVLKELGEKEEVSAKRERVQMLCGYNTDFTVFKKRLSDISVPATFYILDAVGLQDIPENVFAWKKLPGSGVLAKSKTVVLWDAPAGPNRIIPEAWISMLEDNVKKGMHLIVTGGLFALERGEYQDGGLKKLLPVAYPEQRPAPVNLARNAKIAGDQKLVDLFTDQADLLLNTVTPSGKVEVLLTANGKPFIWRVKAGEGKITVISGNLLPGKKNPEEMQKKWNKLLETLILEK